MDSVREVAAWPCRVHHEIPSWVKAGAVFHIRVRADRNTKSLIDPATSSALLEAAKQYHAAGRWHCSLLLVMPDHLHTLLSFGPGIAMAKTIGAWKRFTAREAGISWQTNFFDHRIRTAQELGETWAYILRNPIAKGLCEHESEWPHSWRPE